jgi:hypothetical protein
MGGTPYPDRFEVRTSDQFRRATKLIHREMQRRADLAPAIGHVKEDHAGWAATHQSSESPRPICLGRVGGFTLYRIIQNRVWLSLIRSCRNRSRP